MKSFASRGALTAALLFSALAAASPPQQAAAPTYRWRTTICATGRRKPWGGSVRKHARAMAKAKARRA